MHEGQELLPHDSNGVAVALSEIFQGRFPAAATLWTSQLGPVPPGS